MPQPGRSRPRGSGSGVGSAVASRADRQRAEETAGVVGQVTTGKRQHRDRENRIAHEIFAQADRA